jgi:hypothetical protein
MAANGVVPRVGADGETVWVPALGKVSDVVVSAGEVLNVDIVVTEHPDLIGWEGSVADVLGIRDWRNDLPPGWT